MWIICCPDKHGHLVKRNLRRRHEITRPQFRTEITISNVRDQTDDLAHFRLVRSGRDPWLDSFANHVFIGKEFSSEGLVNNDNWRSFLVVPLVEISSLQYRGTQRLEVTVFNREEIRRGLIPFGDRPAFSLKRY